MTIPCSEPRQESNVQEVKCPNRDSGPVVVGGVTIFARFNIFCRFNIVRTVCYRGRGNVWRDSAWYTRGRGGVRKSAGRRGPRRRRVTTRHDGAVLQRPLPPVLRGVCLAQKPLGWPTP
jgi:hypothetical protein